MVYTVEKSLFLLKLREDNANRKTRELAKSDASKEAVLSCAPRVSGEKN